MANTSINSMKTGIKNTVKQTASQKSQKTQIGGPTISGVQGIGKQSNVKRPMSSQSTKAPKAQHTGVTASGLGEAFDDGYKPGDIVHWKEKAEHNAMHRGIMTGTVVKEHKPGAYMVARHDGPGAHQEIKHEKIIHYHRPIKEERTVYGSYHDWKKELPNDLSHIDSTSEKHVSYAKKKGGDGKLYDVGVYHHHAGAGQIYEARSLNHEEGDHVYWHNMEGGFTRGHVKKVVLRHNDRSEVSEPMYHVQTEHGRTAIKNHSELRKVVGESTETLDEGTFTSNRSEYAGKNDSHGVKYEVKKEKKEGDVYPEVHHVYHEGKHIGYVRPMTWTPHKKIPGSRLIRYLGTRNGFAFHINREHMGPASRHLKYHETSEYPTKKSALQGLANHHHIPGVHELSEAKETLFEVKSGPIANHPWIGKHVKGYDEHDKEQHGIVRAVHREHTFSQMVPFKTELHIRHPETNEFHIIRKDRAKVVKEETIDESPSEWRANRELTGTFKTVKAKPAQSNDYFSHMAAKTAPKVKPGVKPMSVKKPVSEQALSEVKIGDHVHMGFGVRGGAGHRGVVTKLAGTMVHIKQHEADAMGNKWGPREFAGPITHVTVEKSVNENAPAMSVGSGQVAPIAPSDATGNYAFQVKKKLARRLAPVQLPIRMK